MRNFFDQVCALFSSFTKRKFDDKKTKKKTKPEPGYQFKNKKNIHIKNALTLI